MAAAAALYHLFVEHGRLLLRLEALEGSSRDSRSRTDAEATGLPKGSVLADFSLDALSGGVMTLSQHRGERLLLVVVNLDCAFSRDFLTEWASTTPSAASSAPLPMVLCQGDIGATREWFARHPLPCPVLIDERSAVSSMLATPGTPTGYLVDEQGTTSSELLLGSESLWAALGKARREARPSTRTRRFSRSTERSRLLRDGLPKGTPAPPWSLPDLRGTTVALSDFLGKQVLLVFSDPQCEPCSALGPTLARIHRRPTDLSIVMISRGDVEENRRKVAENQLTFTVVLQRHWEISREYGMFATPVAYLIDRAGFLASNVAVGSEAIERLIARCDSSVTEDRPLEAAS